VEARLLLAYWMEVVCNMPHHLWGSLSDGHDQIGNLVVGHAKLGQEDNGDVVEALAIVLEEGFSSSTILPCEILTERVDRVEVSGGFADGFLVLVCVHNENENSSNTEDVKRFFPDFSEFRRSEVSFLSIIKKQLSRSDSNLLITNNLLVTPNSQEYFTILINKFDKFPIPTILCHRVFPINREVHDLSSFGRTDTKLSRHTYSDFGSIGLSMIILPSEERAVDDRYFGIHNKYRILHRFEMSKKSFLTLRV